jgi:hypothetical protein
MNYRIDDYERIVSKASEITNTKYETDYWDCPVLLMALEDMLRQYKKLENDFLEYQANVKENYKRIDVSEQYDIDDKDFI